MLGSSLIGTYYVTGRFRSMSDTLCAVLVLGRRPIVNRYGHLVAIEIDLEHAVDRLAEKGELVERGTEKLLLHRAADRGIRMTRPACSGCAA